MKLLAIGIVLGVVIALGGAVFAHRDAPAAASAPPAAPRLPAAKPALTADESAQLAEVMERVEREYVDEVRSPALIDDALRGLVGGLDPYSGYLDAEEYADLRVSTAGTYAGIGIEVSTADRALRVVTCCPASRSSSWSTAPRRPPRKSSPARLPGRVTAPRCWAGALSARARCRR